MEKLIGQLTSLAPEASEGIRVIAYFDSLLEGRASYEAFLRGAAILTGCAVGVWAPNHHLRMRVDAMGLREGEPTSSSMQSWTSVPLGYCDDGDCAVWIERRGEQHANDVLVLERLAWGLRHTLERRSDRVASDESQGVEKLLDTAAAPGDRLRAAQKLRLIDTDQVRVVALPPQANVPLGRALSAIVETDAGVVRALIESHRAEADVSVAPGTRQGIGRWVAPIDLAESWWDAVVALRLTSSSIPTVAADELGSFARLAEVVDAHTDPLPEVVLLDNVIAHANWALPTLEALATHESVRAAAATLGIHHSTAQSRCETLEQQLGFQVRTQGGRTRLFIDLRLRRLTHNDFAAS